jgi:hypothetical protein
VERDWNPLPKFQIFKDVKIDLEASEVRVFKKFFCLLIHHAKRDFEPFPGHVNQIKVRVFIFSNDHGLNWIRALG